MFNRKTALFCATAVASLLTSNAHAQSAEQGSGGSAASVGEIIVTAQRRSERLQEVPVAVSVVSGETMVKQNIATLEGVSQAQQFPGHPASSRW